MSEQQNHPGDPQSRIVPPRLDETEVEASWQPPADDSMVDEEGDDDRHGLSGPVKGAIVVLALVLIVTGIWALGGFKVRTDVSIPFEPGQQVETGPYEFVFTDATAQKVKDFDDTIHWEVIVRGTGRTTGDESISPRMSDRGVFEARDPDTVEQPKADSDAIGHGDAANFTPGLAPVPYQVTFQFSEYYKPSKEIRFAVNEIEYGNEQILDTGEKSWRNSGPAFVTRLPLTVLPEDVDD